MVETMISSRLLLGKELLLVVVVCVVSARSGREHQDNCAKDDCKNDKNGPVCLKEPNVVFESRCDFERFRIIHEFEEDELNLINNREICSRMARKMSVRAPDLPPIRPPHLPPIRPPLNCLNYLCYGKLKYVCDNRGNVHENECHLHYAMCNDPSIRPSDGTKVYVNGQCKNSDKSLLSNSDRPVD